MSGKEAKNDGTEESDFVQRSVFLRTGDCPRFAFVFRFCRVEDQPVVNRRGHFDFDPVFSGVKMLSDVAHIRFTPETRRLFAVHLYRCPVTDLPEVEKHGFRIRTIKRKFIGLLRRTVLPRIER